MHSTNAEDIIKSYQGYTILNKKLSEILPIINAAVEGEKDIIKLKGTNTYYWTYKDEHAYLRVYAANNNTDLYIVADTAYDENNKFHCDYYFPFFEGKGITTNEDVSVERQLEKMAFSGGVDDYNMGIAIIFYMESIVPYLKYLCTDRLPISGTCLTLSGLSDGGTILLPIKKDEHQVQQAKHYNI